MLGVAKAAGMPFTEAIDYFRQKVNVPSSHWTTLMDEAHARGFAVAGATSDALVQDFREAVDKAISQGTGFAAFRKDFDAIVAKHGWKHKGEPGWRAKVIYETNLRTAFAAGRYAQMTRPDVLAAFPYWEYVHVNCPNPRPQHVAWSGMVLRADDPFWSTCYPPNGFGCHCIVVATNDRGLARMGKDGPDPSPKLEWREYVNQTTGVVTRAPAGVDPGFAYNPGEAWKKNIIKTPDVKPVAKPRSLPEVPPLGTPAQADDTLKAAMAPWAETLSPAEAEALADYKGYMGRQINAAARGAGASAVAAADKDLALTARILEAALDRAKMPMTVRTWRAIGPDEARLYTSVAIGGHVVAPAFVSTSVVRDVVDKLAGKDNRAVVQIIVTKGTRGAAYVHPFPAYRFPQYEVLLNVGTKLRILRNDGAQLVLQAGDESEDDGE